MTGQAIVMQTVEAKMVFKTRQMETDLAFLFSIPKTDAGVMIFRLKWNSHEAVLKWHISQTWLDIVWVMDRIGAGSDEMLITMSYTKTRIQLTTTHNLSFIYNVGNKCCQDSYHPSIFKDSWMVVLWERKISRSRQSCKALYKPLTEDCYCYCRQ